MINAKQELIKELKSNNLDITNIKCASINEVNLKIGFNQNELDRFMLSLDFDYDNGYGSEEALSGIIWLDDSSWLERDEYDGAQYWVINCQPVIPNELLR